MLKFSLLHFCLYFYSKFCQLFRIFFSKLGLLLTINRHLKREQSCIIRLRCVLEIFVGVHSPNYNMLLGFSVTKSICYKDVFVSNFSYPSLRLENSLVVDVDFFFDLLSKWPLILELISSKGKMVIVMVMEMTKFIV